MEPIVTRSSRRQFVKGASAAAGAVVASGYVKPGLRALGVPTALAAVSGPPDTGEEFDTGTPGYWANSGNVNAGGKDLWDLVSDEDWEEAGGLGTNPYVHTTLFNDYFADWEAFDNLTMFDVANKSPDDLKGNTIDAAALKAARSLVAAVLNASFYGSGASGYPFSVQELKDMWAAAVAANTKGAFNSLNCKLDNANNGLDPDAPCP